MTAKLPATYIAARQALATCVRIDECKKWAAKAAALKSYARQMKDSKLEEDAQRIRNRAIQRAGELLAEIEKQHGANQNIKGRETPKVLTRKEAAKNAGLSPDQAKTAVQVAQLEKREADKMIEASPPATVKQLATAGRKPQPNKPKPWPYRNDFMDWTNAVEHLASLPACGLQVLAEHSPHEIEDFRNECDAAIDNLKAWKRELEKAHGTKTSTNKSARQTLVAV